jgi:hypothetical protein
MKHFLFTTNIDQSELNDRFTSEKWPFFFNTKNAGNLKKGDRVIFYHGGPGNHKFIANAKISSITNTSKTREIGIVEISKWKNPIDITEIFEELEIIKNPKCYGVYLAGGIKNLSPNDFESIMRLHKANL